MRRVHEKVIWGLGLLLMIAGVACSNAGLGSPVSPSSSGIGATTIRGTTQVAGVSQSAGRFASRSHAPSTIRVCISGTDTCTEVDGSGNFELTGNFTGDIQLQFTGPQGTVTLTIPNVQPGETILVTVELNGTNGIIRIQSRHGGDDDSDDDSADHDSDDDSADDDSADDDDSGSGRTSTS